MAAVLDPVFEAEAMRFRWLDNWAKLPTPQRGAENQRTHGVAETRDGRLVVFRQADPAVLFYDRQGRLVNSWGSHFLGAHGLTLANDAGREVLLLTDQYSGAVELRDLEGRFIRDYRRPPHAAYASPAAKWSPTWAALAPDGKVWVADGYGQSLVHRYDRDGAYEKTLDGSEPGALGLFKCPHGIGFNPMGELVVVDRHNRRLQIYDTSGNFKRGVSGHFIYPCSVAFSGGKMLVPELTSGVKLVLGETHVVADLGRHEGINAIQGWPNLAGSEHVRPGRFISPHGACFCSGGDIAVVEWVVGGRVTRLVREG